MTSLRRKYQMELENGPNAELFMLYENETARTRNMFLWMKRLKNIEEIVPTITWLYENDFLFYSVEHRGNSWCKWTFKKTIDEKTHEIDFTFDDANKGKLIIMGSVKIQDISQDEEYFDLLKLTNALNIEIESRYFCIMKNEEGESSIGLWCEFAFINFEAMMADFLYLMSHALEEISEIQQRYHIRVLRM